MDDKLLKAGATFDWISPLLGFIQDWINRPAVGFSVPMSAGWGTDTISKLLRSNGIKVWGGNAIRRRYPSLHQTQAVTLCGISTGQ